MQKHKNNTQQKNKDNKESKPGGEQKGRKGCQSPFLEAYIIWLGPSSLRTGLIVSSGEVLNFPV